MNADTIPVCGVTMKRLTRWTVAISFWLVVSSVSKDWIFAADGEASIKGRIQSMGAEKGPLDESGKEIAGIGILLDHKPGGPTCFFVANTTPIKDSQNRKRKVADLKIGQQLRVYHTGEFAKSMPPQGVVIAITIEEKK